MYVSAPIIRRGDIFLSTRIMQAECITRSTLAESWKLGV